MMNGAPRTELCFYLQQLSWHQNENDNNKKYDHGGKHK